MTNDTRTEGRLGSLEATVEQLATAHVQTAQRFAGVEAALERVAAAQAGSEQRLSRVEAALERLADAQARTDQRLQELAAAQARTDQHLQALAAAQAGSEQRLSRVEAALERLARQVGGLSDAIGGDIEDIAYIVLHDVLKREFGWQVGVLARTWQRWNGRAEEIDVFGRATDPARPGRPIWVVGEAKHNLTSKEVDRFIAQVARARRHLVGELFPVCFCYRARPEVQQKVHGAAINLVFSYGTLVRP